MNPSFTNVQRVPHTRALGWSFVNVGVSLSNEDVEFNTSLTLIPGRHQVSLTIP